jgi:hypothetical protein
LQIKNTIKKLLICVIFLMCFARSLKKFNVHLCQKVPCVFRCFQASAAPRPENSDSDEKDELFGLGPQITISRKYLVASNVKLANAIP